MEKLKNNSKASNKQNQEERRRKVGKLIYFPALFDFVFIVIEENRCRVLVTQITIGFIFLLNFINAFPIAGTHSTTLYNLIQHSRASTCRTLTDSIARAKNCVSSSIREGERKEKVIQYYSDKDTVSIFCHDKKVFTMINRCLGV